VPGALNNRAGFASRSNLTKYGGSGAWAKVHMFHSEMQT
jgi:hypothetical protein